MNKEAKEEKLREVSVDSKRLNKLPLLIVYAFVCTFVAIISYFVFEKANRKILVDYSKDNSLASDTAEYIIDDLSKQYQTVGIIEKEYKQQGVLQNTVSLGDTMYLRDKDGNLILDKNGNPILVNADGNTDKSNIQYLRDVNGDLILDMHGNPINVSSDSQFLLNDDENLILDENGNPIIVTSGIQYMRDENGNLVLDENGNPIMIDSKGDPIYSDTNYLRDKNGNLVLDDNGNPIVVDADGNPINQPKYDNFKYAKNKDDNLILDRNGKPIPILNEHNYLRDKDGNLVLDDSGNPIPLDKNGKPVKVQINGEPIQYLRDKNGNLVLDKDGNPIMIDSQGNPILFDKNGNPMRLLDKDGAPIEYLRDKDGNLVLDKSGMPIMIDKKGNPIMIDANGNPMKLNDADGNPLYYMRDKDGNLILDKDGNPILVDKYKQPVSVNKEGNIIKRYAKDKDKNLILLDNKKLPVKYLRDKKKNLITDTKGNPIRLDIKDEPILYLKDNTGKLILDPDGNPIRINKNGKYVNKNGTIIGKDKNGNPIFKSPIPTIEAEVKTEIFTYTDSGKAITDTNKVANELVVPNKINKFDKENPRYQDFMLAKNSATRIIFEANNVVEYTANSSSQYNSAIVELDRLYASASTREEQLAVIEKQKRLTDEMLDSIQHTGGSNSLNDFASSKTPTLDYMQGVNESQIQPVSNVTDSKWTVESKMTIPAKYSILTGFVLPATLITSINSDLPGSIIAQISQNVYDTATGKYLIVPQGTKIYGSYSGDVAFGVDRVFIVWQRLVFPDGRSMDIGNMTGADMSGTSGLADQVNHHLLRTLTAATLMSTIVVTVDKQQDKKNKDNDVTLSSILAQSMGETLSQVVSKNLNISPTVEIRSGYRVNVIVSKDLIFSKPYKNFDY